MAWFMGIDIGALYSKGVIVRDDELVAHHVIPSGASYREAAGKIRDELLSQAELSQGDISDVVATGTGSGNVYFASRKTSDIVCTARGIHMVFLSARTAVDVAAQSTKVVKVDERGLVANFVVSEKCAAGSGRFVDVMANVLRIPLKDFGQLSLKSTSPVTFSTGCAVFGESEAITRVAEGVTGEDIAAGVNKALADKISSLVKRVKLEEPCAICGGGALNIGLVKAVERELGLQLLVPPYPQVITALGAALTAGHIQ